MSPRAHVSERRLQDFARGDTVPAAALAISVHLDTCPECRDRVAAFEALEARLLQDGEAVALDPLALQRVLDAIDQPDIVQTTTPPARQLSDVSLPAAVARAGVGSRRWMAPGLWAAQIRSTSADGWRSFLLRAPAGAVLPLHTHGGGELIAVLQGAFCDGDGTYRAGDFSESLAHSSHRITVTKDAPCACLIAVEGAVQWRGLARAIPPLIGI